jgi:hypothetical protein
MSDQRGTGAGGDGREHEAGEPQDESAEHEFGSSDWLLQQLTGGRRVERSAEDAPVLGESESDVEEQADAEGVGVESSPPVAASPGQVEQPAGFDDLLGRADAEPVVDDEPQTEFPVSFSWNLTPGAGGDPLVEAEAPDVTEPIAGESEPIAAGPETAPFSPEPEPGLEFEPLPATAEPDAEAPAIEFFEPEPEPAPAPEAQPDPEAYPPTGRHSWVIATPPAPVPLAEPEPPRTIFDAPGSSGNEDEPAEEDGNDGHGLAALLGFSEPDDTPSGRSVIGDTTSVIPMPPEAFAQPPSTPVPPATPATPADAAETELALGAIPSPATSPIDAESIAAVSEPQPFAEPLDEETDGVDDLAALFEPGTDGTEGEDEDDPDLLSGPQSEPDTAPEPEPAAGLEGPQLPATTPFTAPPSDADVPGDVRDPYGIGAPPRFTTIAAPIAAGASGGASLPPTAPMPASAASTAPFPAAAASTAAPAAVPLIPDTTGSGPAGPGGAGPTRPTGSGLWGSRNNRILFAVLGALAVVLVLIGLFALGTRIPTLFGSSAQKPHGQAAASATPSATPTPTPTPVPSVTPKPGAAVGAGPHAWDTLGGGECIQPFTTVWAEDFTVVDCTTPHTAQMAYTNLLSADPAAPYPGADALAQQIPGLCTAAGVIDLGAAGAYPDLQVLGSFPATEQQWKAGQRSYYCFANRSSGQPLTTSVAGPGPAA